MSKTFCNKKKMKTYSCNVNNVNNINNSDCTCSNYNCPCTDINTLETYQTLNRNGLREVQDYIVNKNGHYVSYNPKNFDVMRSMRLPLDRPSTTGTVPLDKVYTFKGNEKYSDFSVNNGQITYYIDRDIKDAFYKPIYDIPFDTIKYDYFDPMTSYKPHYVLINNRRDIDNFSQLNFINDSSFHRENLIASQQAKNNQERITPFY